MARTVVVVDDQPEFLDLARRVLNAHPNVDVVGQATSGPEAIRLVLALAPEIVVLDVQMPGMNGLEAARRLHEDSPRVHIVMVSAFDDCEYAHLALAVGAQAFLPKKRLSAEAILAAVG